MQGVPGVQSTGSIRHEPGVSIFMLATICASACLGIVNVKLGKQWRYLVGLLGAALLVSCGGGGDSGGSSGGGGGTTDTQQSATGVWVGKAGPTGAERDFFGLVLPAGTFYFAKKNGAGPGYDGLFGDLTVAFPDALSSNNATYYSTQDGKFLSGTKVSGTVKTTTSISGRFTDPKGTAATTGNTLVPYTVSYSKVMYETDSSLPRIAGTYRSGNDLGAVWNLVITAAGKLSGTINGCAVTGTISIRDTAFNVYTAQLNFAASSSGGVSCSASSQQGIALVEYDATATKTGIWIMTTNAGGTANVQVLIGKSDSSVPTIEPSTTQQVAEGIWSGSVVSGGVTQNLTSVVLPSSGNQYQYFFFKELGAAYDGLYSGGGALIVGDNTSLMSSIGGVYYAGDTSAFTGGVSISGDVKTGGNMVGSYTDPTAGNTQSQFSLAYNTSLYQRASSLAIIQGSYRSGSAFGSSSTITIAADGTISGTHPSSSTCAVGGQATVINAAKNLYQINLSFSGSSCALLGTTQTGVAVVQFNGGVKSGLWLLTAGGSGTTRQSTIFIGNSI